MAPPKKAIPSDLFQVAVENDGNKLAISRHYMAVGYPLHVRTIANMLAEIGFSQPLDIQPAAATIRDMIRAKGADPDAVEIIRVSARRYTMANGEVADYISVDFRPLDWVINPIRVDGWKRPKIKKPKAGQNELVVICGDQHAPEHDKVFHAKFLAWLRENQPSRMIVLGDLLENADISRWEDHDGQATAKESMEAGYYLLRDYIEAAPDMEITWLEGNHDERLEKYQRQNAPKTAKVTRVGETQPVMSIPHIMHLDELRVEYVTGYPLSKVILTERLAVIHGKIVKKGAGATALANLEKRGYSVVSGHTHRAGVVFKTVLDIDDEPSTLLAAETGTMKEIKPEVFDEAPDHQNAFVTAVLWKDGQFHLEPAIYAGGNLRWRDRRY